MSFIIKIFSISILLASIVIALPGCYRKSPEYYQALLQESGVDEVLHEFEGDCRYSEYNLLTQSESTATYQPKEMNVTLYGIYDITNNTVLGVGNDAARLQETIDRDETFMNEAGRFIVTPLNDTMTYIDINW